MAKNRTPNNKNSLPANRQQRDRYKRRAKTQAFGIYRPLTEESKAQVEAVLEATKPDIDEYLAKARRTKPIAELIINKDFGVTFLPRLVVGKAIREFGLLERGFALGRMIDDVGKHNEDNKNRLDIPVDGFGWYKGKRNMVARLSASEGLQELFDQAPIIEDLLAEAKATGGLQVIKPDMVELFGYGTDGDHKDLDWHQRRTVSGMVAENFKEAGIDSLSFGALVLGDSYSQRRGAN